MRKQRLIYNTLSSLIFQLTTIVCGFILPRYILKSFGSEVNGLVNSISQFLGGISFLELGVGAVVQSALYKPLADKDMDEISKIISSANAFFKKIAYILLGYVVLLCFFYHRIVVNEFGWLYDAALIIAISISYFSQYYFGVVDRLLLTADQKGYIQYTAQTITLIVNTILCMFLIKAGAGIHFVKLTTSIVFLARPVVLRIYVNKHYQINKKITLTEEPIAQKWNGAAQHFAAVVLDGTDSIVLSVFSNLSNVSIYAVFNIVESGVKSLFISMTNGIQSLMGELLAKNEKEELRTLFGWTEWVIHTAAIFVFGCTAVLVIPFVRIYTMGVNDCNYEQPLFALVITLAQAGHCLRLPYNLMILAGGHYKKTQRCYVIAAILNLLLSIICVKSWGLIGVAVGTLVAMVYQTVWMAIYISKCLVEWPFMTFLKQCFVDSLIFFSSYSLCSFVDMSGMTVISWIIMGVKTALIWGFVTLLVNLLINRKYIKKLVEIIGKKIGFKKI